MRTIDLVQLGHGSVGKEFLRHLSREHDRIQRQFGIDLHLSAIATSTQYQYKKEGIDCTVPPVWDGTYNGWEDLQQRISYNPRMIVVDMSAADTTALHRAVMRSGGTVVTANKKPLTDSLDAYKELHHTDRYFYETTVGASTPVIQTLQDLVATGDDVTEITATLSGTLGFLCAELRKGELLFSDIVRRAREQGFTEPHPRDDLSGRDVARKALILGREIGLSLEMKDIHLEGLMPDIMAGIDNVEQFLEALRSLDQTYADRVRAWKKEGRVPQFVARIQKGGIRVGLEGVPVESPIGNLRGPENMIVFTTRVFQESPLVLQGRGAGASYTGAGVLMDVMRAVHARGE